MKPVKLSELIMAIDIDSEELVTRVDLQNGTVVTVDQSLVSALEEGDEEVLSEMAEWAKEELETARAIADDSGERFVAPPDKFDFNEYRHMERFIGTVEDARAAEDLWRAIKGKGAFRYFKDTANRLGMLKRWYQYRDDGLKECLLDWAEANSIPCLDDLKK